MVLKVVLCHLLDQPISERKYELMLGLVLGRLLLFSVVFAGWIHKKLEREKSVFLYSVKCFHDKRL